MTADAITWQDPPLPRHREPNRAHRAAQRQAMKENPGQWLLWEAGTKARTYVSRLRAEGFEARSSTRDDGLADIFARWNGETTS